MSKSLVITEKPSVARDIVAALGGFKEEDGYWESDAMVVTFAVGHLFELMAPEDIDEKYKRWTLDTLPIIPESFSMKPKEGTRDRLRTIKSLLLRKDVDRLVNACDAGREGELIFREIVDYNQSEKPIQRLWLQSMTDQAIREGFKRLRDGQEFMGLRNAAYCRTHADWLIGMNATRALTRRLKTRSENQAWSAGRVQTPTLAMLVRREREILEHKPVAFWRIEAAFKHETHAYSGTWVDAAFRSTEDDQEKADRIFDKARAESIIRRIAGKPAQASESRKPSKEAPPPLFDLTSLQREGNRRFGWSARRTLNAAQRCYEGYKVLTYPRTDSRALPQDYRAVVDDILHAFQDDARYGAGARTLLADGLENQDKIFDDSKVSDHFAIVPTGVVPPEGMEGDAARVFDLVTRRFLAAFHPPAVWSRVERSTVVDGETFRSRAKTLQVPGWRAVLGETERDEDESSLPPLVPGEDKVDGVLVEGESFDLKEEETKPPPRVTEARLLSLMENAGEQVEDEDAALAIKEKGIGTPATRADIIENLIMKGYVSRVNKALKPSVKGIRLIDILERMHADRLASARLTGEMEQHLGEVEKNQRKAERFMDEIRDYTREIVELTKGFEFEDLYPDQDSLGPCPLCARPVYERSWFYRCKEPANLREMMAARKEALQKAKKRKNPELVEIPEVVDCPFRIWKDKSGRYIDRTTAAELVQHGKTRILDGFTTRQGKSYRGVLELENGEVVLKSLQGEGGEEGGVSETAEYEVNEAPLGACPICKDGQVVETRATFTCSRRRDVLRAAEKDEASLFALKKKDVPEGMEPCTFVFPRTVCKREITREEAELYIREEKTPLLTDFISQKGRPFSAILLLNQETGRHRFEFPPRGAAAGAAGADGAGAAAKPAARKKKAGKKAAAKKTAAKKSQAEPGEAAEAPAARAQAARAPKKKAAAPKKKAAKKTKRGAKKESAPAALS